MKIICSFWLKKKDIPYLELRTGPFGTDNHTMNHTDWSAKMYLQLDQGLHPYIIHFPLKLMYKCLKMVLKNVMKQKQEQRKTNETNTGNTIGIKYK